MINASKQVGSLAAIAELEARQFQRIFLLGFAVFLLVAMVSRALPSKWRPWSLGADTGARSVIDEALSAANTFIPFAFMR